MSSRHEISFLRDWSGVVIKIKLPTEKTASDKVIQEIQEFSQKISDITGVEGKLVSGCKGRGTPAWYDRLPANCFFKSGSRSHLAGE